MMFSIFAGEVRFETLPAEIYKCVLQPEVKAIRPRGRRQSNETDADDNNNAPRPRKKRRGSPEDDSDEDEPMLCKARVMKSVPSNLNLRLSLGYGSGIRRMDSGRGTLVSTCYDRLSCQSIKLYMKCNYQLGTWCMLPASMQPQAQTWMCHVINMVSCGHYYNDHLCTSYHCLAWLMVVSFMVIAPILISVRHIIGGLSWNMLVYPDSSKNKHHGIQQQLCVDQVEV